MQHKTPFIDIFCGAGGLSVGFELAGFDSVLAVDNDPAAVATYQFNHRHATVLSNDIEAVTKDVILAKVKESAIPLVIGGPNCQGVSLRGKRDPNDPKNKMFLHFLRIIEELRPGWVVMENVPGLLHRHNRDLLTDIFQAFTQIGYTCGADVLLAADYGVPQLRYRFFIIGNRFGLKGGFPHPTHMCPPGLLGSHQEDLFAQRLALPHWRTVADALSDLPPIENGGGIPCAPYPNPPKDGRSEYANWCRRRSKHLHNHVTHRTNDANIALIKHIPPGGNWKSIPPDLRPSRFLRVALKDHTTTYGRLRWDRPARTVTTYFNNITAGAFTHPEQDRGISVREGARLQSFPDRFQFFGPLARQYRQVGNAVPSLMAMHIARAVKSLMSDYDKAITRLQAPAVEYSESKHQLLINRPLRGMRFNLDRHLTR